MKASVALVVLLAITACASPPVMTDKAARIQVHRQGSTMIPNCKIVGPITTTADGWNLAPSYAVEKGTIKARENASDKGGDSLIILNMDSTGDILTIQASALKCYGG